MTASNSSTAIHSDGGVPPRVIYVGPYVDETIVHERGLRGHNAAGSNRMARIGQALAAAGLRPIILSPATSLRAKAPQRFMLPRRMRKTGPVAVVYSACLNVIVLNMISVVLTQLLTLYALVHREPVAGVIFYNSNAANVCMALYLRLFTRVRILHNVEDIYEPKFNDWTAGSKTHPLQNLYFSLGQRLMGLLVDGYIVPTERFLARLSSRPIASVGTGCIEIEGTTPKKPAAPLRVLYAGKIESEHGICQFMDALQILDHRHEAPAFEVDISGAGDQSDFVLDAARSLKNINVRFHGFISKDQYTRLLCDADICLALQDPSGRNAQFKTPSKVYEFIGYGKAVITTDVGDLARLSPHVLQMVPSLCPWDLAALLAQLSRDTMAVSTLQKAARKHAIKYYSYDAVGEVIANMINQTD